MGLFNKNKKRAAAEMAKAQEFERNQYKEMLGMYQPYQDLGKQMFTDFSDYYKRGGAIFDPSKVTVDDPGYEFRRSEGMRGLENSAMARGGLMSGNAIKGAQDYGQELASQEYGNAYNRAFQRHNAELGLRTNMLDWGSNQQDKFAQIKGMDPTGRQHMQKAQEYASKSKGLGGMIGNIGLGLATGGWGGGLGALGSGLLGGMF